MRERAAAPVLREVADVFSSSKLSHQEVWVELDHASRQAELSQKIMSKLGIRSAGYWDHHYPASLRELEAPPWTLFYLGELPVPTIPSLAVVGSRRPDAYGEHVLASIIPMLRTNPLNLISGLAYGVDSLAHYHALRRGIANFAVMGCGLDMIYPSDHHELAEEILQQRGGILSEYPPGTQPLPQHFPQRNRIISGLASVVWIVQGTAKSGTVHTLDHAIRQSKTVGATPGSIFSELSTLPNRILYDGGQMIIRADDLDLLLQRPPATITH